MAFALGSRPKRFLAGRCAHPFHTRLFPTISKQPTKIVEADSGEATQGKKHRKHHQQPYAFLAVLTVTFQKSLKNLQTNSNTILFGPLKPTIFGWSLAPCWKRCVCCIDSKPPAEDLSPAASPYGLISVIDLETRSPFDLFLLFLHRNSNCDKDGKSCNFRIFCRRLVLWKN